MSDPFEIESNYRTLREELNFISSGRLKLLKIVEFLNYLSNSENNSYLLSYTNEFLPLLKSYIEQTDFNGTNPDFFEQVLLVFLNIDKKIDAELKEDIAELINLINKKISKIRDVYTTKTFVSHSFREDINYVNIPMVEKETLLANIDTPFATIIKIYTRTFKTKLQDKIEFSNPKVGAAVNNYEISLKLIKEIIKNELFIKVDSNYKIELWFDKNIFVTGESLNAALYALLICEISNSNQNKYKYYINPSAAITGVVGDKGSILPVDENSLRIKIGTCYFSIIKYLVVPQNQGKEAERLTEELREKYPGGLLEIISIAEIKDIIFDRRIIILHRVNNLRRTYNYLKRNSTIYVSVITVLLFIILIKVLYGPIDKNPVAGTFNGKYLFIKNKYNEEITRVKVGEKTVEQSGGNKKIAFYDIDKDSTNEVVWVEIDATSNLGIIKSKSLSANKLLWSIKLKRKLVFPNNPVENNNFRASSIDVGDFDNDGKPEVYILANGDLYPGFLLKLDALTGKELGVYINTGQFQSMDFVDLNGDRKKEILLAGINNALRSACLVVLDPQHIDGHSPLTEKYKLEGYEQGTAKYYLLISPTIVGQVYKDKSKWNAAGVDMINYKDKIIKLTVKDVNLNLEYIPTFYIFFNFKLRPLYVTTSDYYDMLSEKLYKERKIPFIPNTKYFREYMKTIKYWDGEKWVNKPVINEKYVGLKNAK